MAWWKSIARAGLGIAGTALGGPLGGMVGGALGSALLKDRAPGATGPGAAASSLAGAGPLQAQLTADATANPFASATYRAGVANIQRQNDDAARADAASAAARGMIGGEFELSQASARGRLALDSENALIGQAMQARQSAQGGLLGLLQATDASRQAELERKARSRSATAGALGGVAAATLPAVLGLFNGGNPLRPASGFGQG